MDPRPVAVALASALVASLGQYLMKHGMDVFQPKLDAVLGNQQLLLGASLYAASALLFTYALGLGQLSVVVPVTATGYLWTTLLASRLLGEPVSPVNWAGVLLILLGVVLASLR
jgi:uncharacterized membrane protein